MKSLRKWTPTPSQRKAMMREIEAQTEEVHDELIYIVLYVLWHEFGFGEKRLHKFYNVFHDRFVSLREWLQGDRSDVVWLCKKKLKDNLSIDINEWEEQLNR